MVASTINTILNWYIMNKETTLFSQIIGTHIKRTRKVAKCRISTRIAYRIFRFYKAPFSFLKKIRSFVVSVFHTSWIIGNSIKRNRKVERCRMNTRVAHTSRYYKLTYGFLQIIRSFVVVILGSEEFILNKVRQLILFLSRCRTKDLTV